MKVSFIDGPFDGMDVDIKDREFHEGTHASMTLADDPETNALYANKGGGVWQFVGFLEKITCNESDE